jgi:hypothetical protein
MDWQGWATFGIVATAVLTAIMIAAQMAGYTRMDLPTILGTVVTPDLEVARFPGAVIHALFGQAFGLLYASAFAVLGRSGPLLGAAFGLAHGILALTILIPLLPAVHPRMASERTGPDLATLEPPALFAQNYGRGTIAVTLFAHIAYGAVLGLMRP